MKKALLIVGGIIFVIIFVAAVSGNNNTNQDTRSQQEESRSEQVASRCLDVPIDTLTRVESGLTDDNITLQNAQAVKSNDFESVYFVSADLQGPGLEGSDDIATFSTNHLGAGGLILSIDAVAKEFTVWPHGDREGAQFYITMSDDGARESYDCVSQ